MDPTVKIEIAKLSPTTLDVNFSPNWTIEKLLHNENSTPKTHMTFP